MWWALFSDFCFYPFGQGVEEGFSSGPIYDIVCWVIGFSVRIRSASILVAKAQISSFPFGSKVIWLSLALASAMCVVLRNLFLIMVIKLSASGITSHPGVVSPGSCAGSEGLSSRVNGLTVRLVHHIAAAPLKNPATLLIWAKNFMKICARVLLIFFVKVVLGFLSSSQLLVRNTVLQLLIAASTWSAFPSKVGIERVLFGIADVVSVATWAVKARTCVARAWIRSSGVVIFVDIGAVGGGKDDRAERRVVIEGAVCAAKVGEYFGANSSVDGGVGTQEVVSDNSSMRLAAEGSPSSDKSQRYRAVSSVMR